MCQTPTKLGDFLLFSTFNPFIPIVNYRYKRDCELVFLYLLVTLKGMQKPKIVVIVGPTASGKTGLSIAIAKEFNGEVISSDSRQVYKGLDIGTEKVTTGEMEGVAHHLLDVVEPSIVYTATDYKRDATKVTEDIFVRGHLPIIAGGTFFYVDTFLGRISTPEVPPNPELREELEKLTASELYKRLETLDPKRAANIDPHNHRRLMRSIEVADALGTVPPQEESECPYDLLMIGIETDRKELRARIRARAQEALTKGLVEETQALLNDEVSRERLSEIGLEYRIIMEYMDGDLTDEELIQKLEEKNWQYAKRQLTWLRRDESIEWFEREDIESIFSRVREFLG